MKKLLFSLAVVAAVLVSCNQGPSAEEQAKLDSIKQDSIMRAQQDSIAAIEKAKTDSINAAIEKAKADSIAAAEAKKGGKKK